MQSHAICKSWILHACRVSSASHNNSVVVSKEQDPDVCLQRRTTKLNTYLMANTYFESLQTRPKQSDVASVTTYAVTHYGQAKQQQL